MNVRLTGTADNLPQALEYYINNSIPLRIVAMKFGVGESRIRKALKEQSIPPRTRPAITRSKQRCETAYKKYLNDPEATMTDACYCAGTTRSVFKRWLEENNLTLPDKPRVKKFY